MEHIYFSNHIFFISYWKRNAWMMSLEKQMGYSSWNIINSLLYFPFSFFFFVLKINFSYANHETLSPFTPWKNWLFKEKLLHTGLFWFLLDHATVFHFTQCYQTWCFPNIFLTFNFLFTKGFIPVKLIVCHLSKFKV